MLKDKDGQDSDYAVKKMAYTFQNPGSSMSFPGCFISPSTWTKIATPRGYGVIEDGYWGLLVMQYARQNHVADYE